MTELEDLIASAVTEGVAKSSMLASSLAVRISQNKDFVELVLNNIDYEVLAKQIGNEIARRGDSKASGGFTYSTLMRKAQKRAEDRLIEIMADNLELPGNIYKDYKPRTSN